MPRRVVTREEAQALGTFVQQVTKSPELGVIIDHGATAMTTQRHGDVPRDTAVDQLTLHWSTKLGSDWSVDIDTNVRDVATLQRVIAHAHATATPPVRPATLTDPDVPTEPPPKPFPHTPVSLWFSQTAAAMATEHAEERGAALATMHEVVSTATHDQTWASVTTIGMHARAYLVLSAAGTVAAWGESTDSELSVSVRSADGRASGWSGQARRNWALLQPADVARRAVAEALEQRNVSRAEPGRYTAILSPTAVGQLLRTMAEMYNVVSDSPFNPPGYQKVGDKDRQGERVFDARVMLTTDPADPDGGDFPFFEDGYPSNRVTWVDRGILRHRSVNPGDGLMLGMTPYKNPLTVRLSSAPSSASTDGPTTVAEMIARCDRGLYVHRFANLQVVDYRSGAMSGFTRDGCLFIEKGKIVRPVKDFRIFESPFLLLNRVLALGTPERIAFGFAPLNPYEFQLRWPMAPVIAPPLMVADFNFAALSDAT